MASRLRLFAADSTPGAVEDSDPNPGASVKAAAAGGREGEAKRPEPPRREVTDLGGSSEVVHVPRFVAREKAWEWFDYLDKTIPWTRPQLRVFGRSSIQPRQTCYVAAEGLTELKYSGYKPHVYSWDEFPVLKDILKAIQDRFRLRFMAC